MTEGRLCRYCSKNSAGLVVCVAYSHNPPVSKSHLCYNHFDEAFEATNLGKGVQVDIIHVRDLGSIEVGLRQLARNFKGVLDHAD